MSRARTGATTDRAPRRAIRTLRARATSCMVSPLSLSNVKHQPVERGHGGGGKESVSLPLAPNEDGSPPLSSLPNTHFIDEIVHERVPDTKVPQHPASDVHVRPTCPRLIKRSDLGVDRRR